MKEIEIVLQNIKQDLIIYTPKILLSLAVLIVGYLLAKLLKFVAAYLTIYIGKLIPPKFKVLNSKLIGKFIGIVCFWLVILGTILLITDILELTIVTKWLKSVVHYVPNIIAALLIIFGAIFLSNLVSDFLLSLSKNSNFQYNANLSKVIRFAILAMATIIALDQIGIEISLLVDIIDIFLAALLFGAALAFGLGAKSSISNILAIFYVRKTYREGDEIQIGKLKGRIVKIDTAHVIIDSGLGKVSIPANQFNISKSYLITKN